jgi:hypothetical protein
MNVKHRSIGIAVATFIALSSSSGGVALALPITPVPRFTQTEDLLETIGYRKHHCRNRADLQDSPGERLLQAARASHLRLASNKAVLRKEAMLLILRSTASRPL